MGSGAQRRALVQFGSDSDSASAGSSVSVRVVEAGHVSSGARHIPNPGQTNASGSLTLVPLVPHAEVPIHALMTTLERGKLLMNVSPFARLIRNLGTSSALLLHCVLGAPNVPAPPIEATREVNRVLPTRPNRQVSVSPFARPARNHGPSNAALPNAQVAPHVIPLLWLALLSQLLQMIVPCGATTPLSPGRT